MDPKNTPLSVVSNDREATSLQEDRPHAVICIRPQKEMGDIPVVLGVHETLPAAMTSVLGEGWEHRPATKDLAPNCTGFVCVMGNSRFYVTRVEE